MSTHDANTQSLLVRDLLEQREYHEASIETLELEKSMLESAVNRFLAQEAPTYCDQCDGAKLYCMNGILACSSCRRGWDPRTGNWDWEKEDTS